MPGTSSPDPTEEPGDCARGRLGDWARRRLTRDGLGAKGSNVTTQLMHICSVHSPTIHVYKTDVIDRYIKLLYNIYGSMFIGPDPL